MMPNILEIYKFIMDEIDNATVLKALFSSDCKKIFGSNELNVRIHKTANEKIWFYDVVPFEDYVMVPMPVNPSVHTDYGTPEKENNARYQIFRYVQSPMAQFMAGGEPNLQVDFIVFGYKPSDLVSYKYKK